MGNARISIASGDFHVEVEGDPAFVEKHIRDLNALLKKVGDARANAVEIVTDARSETEGKGVGKDARQTLHKFVGAKKPRNVYEAIACVLYYAKNYQDQPELETGNVRTSLVQGKYRPPGNMVSAMTDCRRKYGFVEVGSKKGFWKLSHQGETLVEFDLPAA